jgi:hypothetical protein
MRLRFRVDAAGRLFLDAVGCGHVFDAAGLDGMAAQTPV